jgi:hypothetical protein
MERDFCRSHDSLGSRWRVEITRVIAENDNGMF